MAGDWIKMRSNLWDDPRVGRLCDLTGSKEATVIGALYWLWATADQHTEDGCMPGLSMQQIDRKTGVKGFAAALVDIGWLADDPQGVVIKHFEEHNGASAKKRLQTAKRVANHRNGNDDETPKEQIGNAQSVTPALAREEKREEIPPIAPQGGRRGERLPDGWDPGDDGMAFAAGEGLANGAVAAELAKFRDYWAAVPGVKGRKTDWPATWRNWVRKAAETRPRQQQPNDLADIFRRGQA